MTERCCGRRRTSGYTLLDRQSKELSKYRAVAAIEAQHTLQSLYDGDVALGVQAVAVVKARCNSDRCETA